MVKEVLKERYIDEDVWKYLHVISESENEVIYGLFVNYEQTEYLVKMMKMPRHSKITAENFIESISKKSDGYEN